MYVNENGEADALAGLTVPAPFSLIVTCVALPPNVLPATVTSVVPASRSGRTAHVTVGPLTHPHDTSKLTPVVVHPAALRTVIV